MKSILIPVDMSPPSRQALVFALDLAQEMQARCYILLVTHIKGFESHFLPLERIVALENEEIARSQKALQEFMEHVMEEFPDYRTVSHELLVRIGLVVEEVISVTDEQPFDLVVMGTQGTGSTQRKFMGSNTVLVIENVCVPILSIPEDTPCSRPDKILFCTNIHRTFPLARTRLVSFARAFDAEIFLLYVNQQKDGVDQQTIDQTLEELAYTKASFHQVEGNNITEAVGQFAATHDINLIAVATHDRSTYQKLFSPSLVTDLTRHLKIPLLTVHN